MFKLPELPYAYDALQPTVSDLTMHTHHDKHHKAYIDATNALVTEKGLAGKTLEEVIKHAKSADEKKLFNQSAQVWNHGFFWESMAPGGLKPEGDLAAAITAFGGLDALKTAFVNEGVTHFASGWVWLVADASGVLKVISTHDADTAAILDGLTPLIVCDVWEHAYYLDYKNVRKSFIETWFDAVANWSFAAAQLKAAKSGSGAYRYPAPSDQAAAA